MQRTSHRLASWVYATLFGVAATYHFFVLLDSDMPHVLVGRHLIFFLVDGSFAALLWFWPRWLFLPVGILTVQQFYSHGGNVWRAWHHGRVDALGTFTLSALVVLCFLVAQGMLKRRCTKTCGT
jgi:hypothetical protein